MIEAVHPPAICTRVSTLRRDCGHWAAGRLTGHDHEVCRVPSTIFCLDTDDLLVAANVLGDEARELTLGFAENKFDASLLAEIPCVDASLWTADCELTLSERTRKMGLGTLSAIVIPH